MAKKVKSDKNKGAELPWNVDRFVSEDNTPERDEPKELEEYHFPWYIVKNNVAAGGSILPNLIIWAQNNW